jgi:hypothetical protein
MLTKLLKFDLKSSVVSSEPKSTNQSQYRSASREEMAAAAERRINEQKTRGSKGFSFLMCLFEWNIISNYIIFLY